MTLLTYTSYIVIYPPLCIKAQHCNRLPISPYKNPSLTKFRSFKFSLPRLPVALRLTVRSNLTEPGLELGSILLSLVKIQPS